MESFDLLVLGGGTAGLTITRRALAAGWRVALAEGFVEGSDLGGTCVNVGCVPTKVMIQSARVMHCVSAAERFGVATGPARLDYGAVLRRKDDFVRRLRESEYRMVESSPGLTLYRGIATFEGPGVVRVAGERVSGRRVVIATGARSLVPPLPGLEEIDYLTSASALSLTELPETLLIVGGGAVAVEFAQMYARFGVRVTILQRGPRLLPGLEPEITSVLAEVLDREGVRIVTGAEVIAVEGGGAVTARAAVGGEEQGFTAERLLFATSRRPNTDALGLERAGVATDAAGFVTVDGAFRTTAENVWALGDVLGGAMFTNRAWHDAYLLGKHLFDGEEVDGKNRLVPYAVFTDPEIASVGMGEVEAGKRGIRIRKKSFPFRRVARARALGEEDGLVKLVADEGGRVLGAHLVGPRAGELIHELAMAIRLGGTLADLQDMIHVHQTVAEAINSAALSPDV